MKLNRLRSIVTLLLVLTITITVNANTHELKGKASYYGSEWNRKKTASGRYFDTNQLTAAHKTLPFGSIVKVTNLSNGKSVNVTITDRGPYVAGRVIDLSKASFSRIESLDKGVTKIQIEVIQYGNWKYKVGKF